MSVVYAPHSNGSAPGQEGSGVVNTDSLEDGAWLKRSDDDRRVGSTNQGLAVGWSTTPNPSCPEGGPEGIRLVHGEKPGGLAHDSSVSSSTPISTTKDSPPVREGSLSVSDLEAGNTDQAIPNR